MHGTFILVWEKILQFSAYSRLIVATEWSLSEEVEVRVDPVICTFGPNYSVITFRDKIPVRIFIDLRGEHTQRQRQRQASSVRLNTLGLW